MKNFHHIVRTILVCGCVSATLAGVNAWADLTADQAEALQTQVAAGNQAALETLMAEARKGNPYAQFSLGVLYADGQGVPQDYGQAALWLRKAAAQGNAAAQFNLGLLYEQGQGVPQDYGQAAQWYRKAAAQGFAGAQYNLGVLYDKGQGVPQDYGQAAQWFRKAAAQGFAGAQSSLGYLYGMGQGVPQDKVVAYALLNLAAAQESSSGDHTASSNRSRLAAGMTEQAIEAGQALSRKMSVPGNLLKALDSYLAGSGSR
jgi:TPR repeat protein